MRSRRRHGSAVANARLRGEVDERVRELDASSGASSRPPTTSVGRSNAVSRRARWPGSSGFGRSSNDDLLSDVLEAAPVDVRGAVRAADDELRAFARGVYPPALTTGGLAAAIAELAAAGTLPVAVAIEGGRLPVDVEGLRSEASFGDQSQRLGSRAYLAQSGRRIEGGLHLTGGCLVCDEVERGAAVDEVLRELRDRHILRREAV